MPNIKDYLKVEFLCKDVNRAPLKVSPAPFVFSTLWTPTTGRSYLSSFKYPSIPAPPLVNTTARCYRLLILLYKLFLPIILRIYFLTPSISYLPLIWSDLIFYAIIYAYCLLIFNWLIWSRHPLSKILITLFPMPYKNILTLFSLRKGTSFFNSSALTHESSWTIVS